MNRGRELAKNTMIISIGKIGTQFVSFLLLPLYTAKLTTEEYGTVDLLNTYISLLIPIIVFQIEQAIFRYLIDAREKEYEKEKLITRRNDIIKKLEDTDKLTQDEIASLEKELSDSIIKLARMK